MLIKFLCLFFMFALVFRSSSCQEEDVCLLPLKTGPCRKYLPRFGFDATEGKCKKFVYGGCGGNDNRFQSLDECEEACAS